MRSSMVGGLSHILWKIKNVPNHQSEYQYDLTWPILDTMHKKKNFAGEQVIPLIPKDYRVKVAIYDWPS